MTQNTLIEGDALAPSDSDMIAQRVYMPLDDAPKGRGWRVMTGNPRGNLWARVAYRYQVESDQ